MYCLTRLPAEVDLMGMRHNRKGMSAAVVGIWALVLLVAGIGGYMMFKDGGSDAPAQIVDLSGGTSANPQSCLGINSVAVTYDDQDEFTPGTDPGVSNLFVFTDRKGSLAEGSNSLTPSKAYEALAGQNATAFFGAPVEFTTGCSDAALPVEVAKAGAPTITITNDNGVTINSDSNAEAMAADSTYTQTVTVKAPAKQCAAKYGAIIVADYDKTYVQKIEFLGLPDDDEPGYLAHVNGDNSTSDGFKAALWDGELCNAAKEEIEVEITTTSATPNEGNANVVYHWLPRNYDVNLDSYELLGPATEDEDDNAIVLGNVTAESHAD